ncbi:MAG: tRNA (adenosine(37)-N6)-threonylcarbamoyltransferase complex ATPase subunit type 1 TsaE, partial [Acidobacteria bacterium]|nr:tRNA (adenosine(37)-N6)-threonylcarbamoyltransferase complex ATPase subunit type 1 TsaE [Acidobacteriota bacterium]MCA1608066.1 tRNA (adenosine(37)-N6)-threonylcarbamoyltransferase complex ATPase subunit type 1 TsaE [Acidobacteriota bacterium]
IDLWRLEKDGDPAGAVGLHEILEDPNAIVIVEWGERLGEVRVERALIRIDLSGEGEGTRSIKISGG